MLHCVAQYLKGNHYTCSSFESISKQYYYVMQSVKEFAVPTIPNPTKMDSALCGSQEMYCTKASLPSFVFTNGYGHPS